MPSGDFYSIPVDTSSSAFSTYTSPYTTTTNLGWTYTPNYYYWSTPVTVYKYQVKCPKQSCKKMNWLELDKITPCTKCGAKLKAVSEQAEFEIAIEE